ncbi:MAG: RNA methyltransferase [Cryomorphaceae bacterium]
MGQFIVEGIKCVEEAMSSGWNVERIYILEANHESSALQSAVAQRVSAKEMQALTALSTPSPALAVVQIPQAVPFNVKEHVKDRLLMLDEISDPGNLGTIIRTADWFGLRNVVLSENCVDIFNPKAVQASMGSVFRVNAFHEDLGACIRSLRSESDRYSIIAAVMDGALIQDLRHIGTGAMIIGSEAHGIRPEILDLATDRRSIPGVVGAESLNASIAAGILMYAWTR